MDNLHITFRCFVDSDPVCEPHLDTHEIIGPNTCGIEPNHLILSCTVKYKGNEAPIMTWLRVGDKTTISDGVTHEIMDNNRVVYNLTIKGNSNVKDGDSYFCNTTRSVTESVGCDSGKIKVKGTGISDLSLLTKRSGVAPYLLPCTVQSQCLVFQLLDR